MAIVMKASNPKYRDEHDRIFGKSAKKDREFTEKFIMEIENGEAYNVVGTCPKCGSVLGESQESGNVKCLSCNARFKKAPDQE